MEVYENIKSKNLNINILHKNYNLPELESYQLHVTVLLNLITR